LHTDDIAKIEVTSSVSLLQLNFSGLVRGLQPEIKAMINKIINFFILKKIPIN
jgi:hypothetical protein